MLDDSVVAEVRAVREQYAAQFGFDVAAIASDLKERERVCGRVVLHPPAAETGRSSEAASRTKDDAG
jgi:hypothetical protein